MKAVWLNLGRLRAAKPQPDNTTGVDED